MDDLDRTVEAQMRLIKVRRWSFLGIAKLYIPLLSLAEINGGVQFTRAWALIGSLLDPLEFELDKDRVAVTTGVMFSEEGMMFFGALPRHTDAELVCEVLARSPPKLCDESAALFRAVFEGVDP